MRWGIIEEYYELFFILGFVFLLCSLLLFILFRIPGVFFYLSGSRQKKNISLLRKKREEEKKRGYSVQGKIDMDYLRMRSEEKQKEQRKMAEQSAGMEGGEITAQLLRPEDRYKGQETGILSSSEKMPGAERRNIKDRHIQGGISQDISQSTLQDFQQTAQLNLQKSAPSTKSEGKEKKSTGYLTLYEMESES